MPLDACVWVRVGARGYALCGRTGASKEEVLRFDVAVDNDGVEAVQEGDGGSALFEQELDLAQRQGVLLALHQLHQIAACGPALSE
jgi:hypothetical protein